MDDKDRDALVRKARNHTKELSGNDLHEIQKIMSSGLNPWYRDLNDFLAHAFESDDAVILKQKLKGSGSLNSNEKFRLDEAINRRGRRML